MMRSLSSAVGGLRAHQTKMDVIGNNIANVNTYGFKSSRATFSDVYYQTMSRGSAPAATMGGTNPTQIGYGAAVATIDVMNTQSGLASTDRALDIYLNGDGMIVTRDVNGNLLYTRLGILGFDAEGNLVDSNGNFVMGFPMDENGRPMVNPDGTCDIDRLSRIQVIPEMLDQMTGISIGPNGEIVGTMPGDVATSVNRRKPDWLTDVIVAPDSNIVGDIKVTMEYRSTSSSPPLNAPWITNIACKPNSRVTGDYVFEYMNGTITARNTTTNETLTGTYRKGSMVDLVNAKGQAVMSITTHQFDEPGYGAAMPGPAPLGTMTFQERLMLSVEATDKGGNRVYDEIEYQVGRREIVMGDVTLIIDAENAAETSVMTLIYDPLNPFAAGSTGPPAYDGWLNSVFLEPSATYSGNELRLRAGVSQSVTPLYSGNNYLNFMDRDKVEELILALNIKGNYTISTEEVTPGTPADGFRYVISADGMTPVKSNNIITSIPGPTTDITFTPPSGTGITVGRVGAEQFTVANPASGLSNMAIRGLKNVMDAAGILGQYSLEMTDVDNGTITGPGGATYIVSVSGSNLVADVNGTEVVIGTKNLLPGDFDGTIGNYQGGVVVPGTRLASLSESSIIQLVSDSNSILSEVQYNGASTIILGDLCLRVDRDLLNDYFATRPRLTDPAAQVTLGAISLSTEPDWIYSNNVANAQPGIGQAYTIGNLVVGKIPNMVAMEQSGQSYFITTANSGDATFVKPGISGTGTIKAGYLEMSNVDIAKEFTDMITTQRGFQANTRIITVSDEMLQELVNLKR